MTNARLATKFLKTEEEAKQQWLSILASQDSAPVDVSYKATCEIHKEYFPYAVYSMDCYGEWTATSIWEREEKRQVAREETVFLDYKGKEHRSQGRDKDTRGGQVKYHVRTPHSRTVYETKTEMVPYQVEQTSGSAGPMEFIEHVALSDLPRLSWTHHFSSDQFIEVEDDSFFEDYDLVPATVSSVDAAKEAKNEAYSELSSYAKGKVPGDRCENFSIACGVQSSTRIDCYLAVYHIVYRYEGESYECWLTGGLEEEDNLFGPHPVDDSIQEHAELLKKQLSKNSWLSRKLIFLLFAIVSALLALVNVPGIIDQLSYGILNPSYLKIYINCFLFGVLGLVYFGLRFLLMHRTHGTLKTTNDQFHSDNTFMRKQVLELAQNDAISDEEKKDLIESWLSTHAGGTAAGFEQTKKTVSSQKAKVRALNIIGVAGIIAIIAINILINFASCAADSAPIQTEYAPQIESGYIEDEATEPESELDGQGANADSVNNLPESNYSYDTPDPTPEPSYDYGATSSTPDNSSTYEPSNDPSTSSSTDANSTTATPAIGDSFTDDSGNTYTYQEDESGNGYYVVQDMQGNTVYLVVDESGNGYIYADDPNGDGYVLVEGPVPMV
ncbi:MAG: hypothetical protein HFJ72_08955 [Adlercreutzia sp.]|nr:hypothetical protein [Adlercreutzia sp.]